MDVGKHDRRPTEDIVFERHPFVDRYVVLDLNSVANEYVGSDDDVLSNAAIFSNLGSSQDVGEMPDIGSFANFNFVVDHSGLVNEISWLRLKWTPLRNGALSLQRFLASLQHVQDPKPFI